MRITNSIKVPRCYVLLTNIVQLQVIGFCDASEKAFAAVTYLRAVYEDKTISCSLVASKTRVAPVKNVSIPRLELCVSTCDSKVNQKGGRSIEKGSSSE